MTKMKIKKAKALTNSSLNRTTPKSQALANFSKKISCRRTDLETTT